MKEPKEGMIVKASYKTGQYVGEVIDLKPGLQKAVVKILAVLKHPKQGDLHGPNKVEGVSFHQRKALAYTEKALVPYSALKEFSEDLPEYNESLRQAVNVYKDELKQKGDKHSQTSLQCLNELETNYF